MMTQQQQQILVRSALAAGVTLAVGLVGVGFATGVSPRGASAPAPAGVVAALTAEQAALARDASLAVVEGVPVDSTVMIAGEAAGEPREFARAFDHEDEEWDEHEDGDDEDGRHGRKEREGGWEALKRTFERREHR